MKKRRSPGSPRSGAAAERSAAWLYRLRGYRILARNEWLAGYELDLVVRRGRTLVFCEVKSKSSADLGDPLEMVNAEKQRRITAAAQTWLAIHPEHGACEIRFDVVAARGQDVERIGSAF